MHQQKIGFSGSYSRQRLWKVFKFGAPILVLIIAVFVSREMTGGHGYIFADTVRSAFDARITGNVSFSKVNYKTILLYQFCTNLVIQSYKYIIVLHMFYKFTQELHILHNKYK